MMPKPLVVNYTYPDEGPSRPVVYSGNRQQPVDPENSESLLPRRPLVSRLLPYFWGYQAPKFLFKGETCCQTVAKCLLLFPVLLFVSSVPTLQGIFFSGQYLVSLFKYVQGSDFDEQNFGLNMTLRVAQIAYMVVNNAINWASALRFVRFIQNTYFSYDMYGDGKIRWVQRAIYGLTVIISALGAVAAYQMGFDAFVTLPLILANLEGIANALITGLQNFRGFFTRITPLNPVIGAMRNQLITELNEVLPEINESAGLNPDELKLFCSNSRFDRKTSWFPFFCSVLGFVSVGFYSYSFYQATMMTLSKILPTQACFFLSSFSGLCKMFFLASVNTEKLTTLAYWISRQCDRDEHVKRYAALMKKIESHTESLAVSSLWFLRIQAFAVFMMMISLPGALEVCRKYELKDGNSLLAFIAPITPVLAAAGPVNYSDLEDIIMRTVQSGIQKSSHDSLKTLLSQLGFHTTADGKTEVDIARELQEAEKNSSIAAIYTLMKQIRQAPDTVIASFFEEIWNVGEFEEKPTDHVRIQLNMPKSWWDYYRGIADGSKISVFFAKPKTAFNGFFRDHADPRKPESSPTQLVDASGSVSRSEPPLSATPGVFTPTGSDDSFTQRFATRVRTRLSFGSVPEDEEASTASGRCCPCLSWC